MRLSSRGEWARAHGLDTYPSLQPLLIHQGRFVVVQCVYKNDTLWLIAPNNVRAWHKLWEDSHNLGMMLEDFNIYVLEMLRL